MVRPPLIEMLVDPNNAEPGGDFLTSPPGVASSSSSDSFGYGHPFLFEP